MSEVDPTRRAPAGPFVLVVEDDFDLRDAVTALLEQEGFRAVGCASGAAALTFLRAAERLPALILLDLMMPGINGWELREALLREEALAGIPVVVMTASRNPAGIPVDEVLFKPVRLEQLLDVVARHGRLLAG